MADVSRRSRLDGIAEAIRVVVCELAESYPQLRDHISFRTLFDEYRHPGWLGISSEDPSFSHRCPFRITSIPESFVDAPFGRDPEPPQRITITHELQRPLHVSAHRRNRKFMRRTRGFLQTAINKRSDKYRNGHSSRRRGATRHQLLAIERRYILAVLQGANTR